jgi:hypothetical protein
MDSRAIPHDTMHPGEERGAPLKLMQIAKGQQQTILQGVLGIFWIAKHPSGGLPEFWKAQREQFVDFRFGHIDGQEPLQEPLPPNSGRRCNIGRLDQDSPYCRDLDSVEIQANPGPMQNALTLHCRHRIFQLIEALNSNALQGS